ncbi:YfhO family protein [Halobacillus mangrovi]|uniref:YfhO family protein n=1 Tax=Halobacillus mangrovi TaxID=402384 RepID=UPI003D97D425
MKKFLWILLGSLLAASLSHLFFLQEWADGGYMAGPNDGLNQMLPFKQLIYENYTSGNFFYSFEFGFGGGIYGQLGYYFSTNLFFLLTIVVVFLLELMHIIDAPDVLFWAQLTVFTSTLRMATVIVITTYVFRYFSIRALPAFVGAALYGSSVIYFRHVIYWEFFADAFLFIPILVLGVEKIIREQKPGWFLFGVAATLFNNFYFSYISLLFIGIYLLVRWLIPLEKHETGKLKQVKLFLISGGLGFGIGSLAFIPTVYAYLNNYRPSFNQERPLLDLSDNILLDSRTFLLAGVVVIFLFLFSFYKNRLFRFFASMTILFIIFHFSPFMGSVFNGFSAPRNRFEYGGFFVAGALVAVSLHLSRHIKKTELFIAVVLTILMYRIFALSDQHYSIDNIYDVYMIVQIAVTVASVYLISMTNKKLKRVGISLLVLINAGMMNAYQYDKLFTAGNIQATTKDYIQSDAYDSEKQSKLIETIEKQNKHTFYRVEWRGMDDKNNMPLIQDFQGTSVYSSILNKNVLFWYYDSLEIDMKRESISRYSGFGDRANLYSLMKGNYIVTHENKERNMPYGFEPFLSEGGYQVYQNTNKLPFARTTSTVYSERSLEDTSMVGREHAMLQGIVLENPKQTTTSIEPLPNLMDQAEVESVRSTYKDGQLNVEEKTGGIDLKLSNVPEEAEDLYVSFYLKNNVKEAPWFPLHVNDFKTSRKSRESFYRTGINNITIRVPKEEKISIRVPKGSYQLKDLEVYSEDYKVLEKVSSDRPQPANVEVNGNQVHVQLDNQKNHRYLTIPVPYEKGWHVKVNGEQKDILKANYAFLGVELEEGKNDITFTYRPPYFSLLSILSILSLMVSLIWLRKRR